MKNALRIVVLLTLVIATTSIANAGIIITNRNASALSEKQACSDQSEKSITGIIITNLTGIIITNFTGIIIVNATDGEVTNCGIIITN